MSEMFHDYLKEDENREENEKEMRRGEVRSEESGIDTARVNRPPIGGFAGEDVKS